MDTRLTHSQLQTLKTCPRKHYLSYVCGLRPVLKSTPLNFGSAFHEGLDARARGATRAEAANVALNNYMRAFTVYEQLASESDLEQFWVDHEILRQLFWCYMNRWDCLDKTYKVLASELSFSVPIANPATGETVDGFVLAGKIDKIIELPDGEVVIVEHKTTSSDIDFSNDYFARLRIDLQVSVYILAARALGYPVRHVIYDVIHKPRLQPRELTQSETATLLETSVYVTKLHPGTEPVEIHGGYCVTDGPADEETGFPQLVTVNGFPARIIPGKRGFAIRETLEMFGDRLRAVVVDNPEKFFARRVVVRLERDLTEAQHDIYEQTQILQQRLEHGYWSRNDRACVGFGRCQYFSICTEGQIVTPNDNQLIPPGFYIADDVHEELVQIETGD